MPHKLYRFKQRQRCPMNWRLPAAATCACAAGACLRRRLYLSRHMCLQPTGLCLRHKAPAGRQLHFNARASALRAAHNQNALLHVCSLLLLMALLSLLTRVSPPFGSQVAFSISLENASNALPCEKSLFPFYILEFDPLSEIRLPMLQFVSPPKITTNTK